MYCKRLFGLLDKDLEKKMSIDEIANDICNDVKYPRRKIIGLIKIHKGEDYLVKNASWLKYYTSNVREYSDETQNVCDIQTEQKIVCDATKYRCDDLYKSPIEIMFIESREREKDNINEHNGISLHGWLSNDNDICSVRYLCEVRPYIKEDFYYVIMRTFINFGEDRYNDRYNSLEDDLSDDENDLLASEIDKIEAEADNDNFKMHITRIGVPVPRHMVSLAIDVLLAPRNWHNKMVRLLNAEKIGEYEFPSLPSKSSLEWEWNYYISERTKVLDV